MTSIDNRGNDPNEMFVLLPVQWDFECDGFMMDFITDNRSPVDVLLRPWMATDEQANLFFALERPYSLVRAKMSTVPKKEFHYELVNNLGTVNIYYENKSTFYSSISNIRWNTYKKRKNAFTQINAQRKKDFEITKNQSKYVNCQTQTEISGIIHKKSSNKDENQVCEEISLLFLWTLLYNCFQKQRRYNNEVYDLSMIFYLSSAKTYNLCREFLPLPAYQNLYAIYGKQIEDEKSNLVDMERIDSNIKNYILTNGIDLNEDGANVVVLAIDAFSFKSFMSTVMTPTKNSKSNENKVVYNNGFIFLMVSVDFRYTQKILHIEKASNGNYNDHIEDIASKIINIIQSNGLKVWFKATDGDRYLSDDHLTFFNNYIEGQTSNFMKLVSNIYLKLSEDEELYIPVGDPFHLWKSVRSRYQNNIISLFSESSSTTDIDKTKEILDAGKELDDYSSAGKMRDSYALKLFTFQNVSKLLSAGLYIDAALFFPFACWIASDFSINIDLEFRLFLLEVAFQLIERFRENFFSLKKNGVLQKARDEVEFVTLHENQYMIRMLNSIIASAVALLYTSNYIRTDAIGTHLVENNIGNARQTSNNDPRYERIISSFAHSELRKKLATQYNIKLHVSGRINDGGCKINEIEDSKSPPGTLISKPENWNVVNILELFAGLCNPATSNAFKDDCKKFINDLDQIGNILNLKERNINDAANSGILARLISFKSED